VEIMTAPFYPTGAIGEEAGFIAIFFLGLLFGFFLERAGFGSARKLAAIFYLRDWAVLRVMFTAIVVAMTGLLYLGGMGWIETAAVALPPTWLGAQIAGGLLLGIGFIVGGYCPGTSAVAAASGKLDSLAYIGGLVSGSFLFGAGFDWLKPLYTWGEMGEVTLPAWLGIHPGAVAAAVILMALAAFGATHLPDRGAAPSGRNLRLSFERASALTLAVLGFGLLVGYAMASRVQPPPVQAAAPPPVAARPAAAGPAAPAPAPSPPPAAIKRFKKGSSCS
jgi:hypothetical protein